MVRILDVPNGKLARLFHYFRDGLAPRSRQPAVDNHVRHRPHLRRGLAAGFAEDGAHERVNILDAGMTIGLGIKAFAFFAVLGEGRFELREVLASDFDDEALFQEGGYILTRVGKVDPRLTGVRSRVVAEVEIRLTQDGAKSKQKR